MELVKDGIPSAGMVTTSWLRDDLTNGHKRFRIFAIHVPLIAAVGTPAGNFIQAQHPRLAGPPLVIGEVTIEVPNLEVANILHAAMSEMLNRQPPEIIQVKATQ